MIISHKLSDINHVLNFRYYPKTYLNLYGSTLQEYPPVFDHFKLVVHRDGHYVNYDASSNDVFCIPILIKNLLCIIKNDALKSFDNLVCCGADRNLSLNLNILDQIKSKFNKIYYEAKDVECDWVQTIPMGVNTAYMLINGGNDVILPQINKKKNKSKLIASAFGSQWPELLDVIPDRKKLKNFTDNFHFMDDIFCEPIEYYRNLCDYRFFACPLGNGIQTPKICECIMCETVPVVTNHVAHRELRDIYGLPLLIVNEWTDLTEGFLNDQWNSVYSKVDWAEQKSKFLVKNFSNLLQNKKL